MYFLPPFLLNLFFALSWGNKCNILLCIHKKNYLEVGSEKHVNCTFDAWKISSFGDMRQNSKTEGRTITFAFSLYSDSN